MNQRIPLLRILLSAAAAALSAVCAYALLMRYQDVFSQLPLYVLLVPIVWLLLFTAASFKPRLWILLTIPYFSVAVTAAVYSLLLRRFYADEWMQTAILCLFFLVGMGFVALLFAGVRRLRAKKRLTGLLGILLSAVLLLAPIFVFRGNPVTTIRARRTLCAWMEENLDRERYEVGDFQYEWLEGRGYTYALLDRETGRRAWLEYSLGKDGEPPAVHASWDANR
ncbi:MAG: hypothetical protein II557_03055 [Clostridia bacterium]|nr:hypothetical protein [Clostridia bacterium]